MTDYTLTEEEWTALSEAAHAPDGRGPSFGIASNVDPDTDNVHVRRVGPAGGGLKARAVVYVETLMEHEDEDVEDEIISALVYISAPEARQLAAALLNVADEIDGKTPLVFFPRTPSGEEAPEVEEPTVLACVDRQGNVVSPTWAGLTDYASVTGDTGMTGHSFTAEEPVEVLDMFVSGEGQPRARCRSLARPALAQVVAQADLAPLGTADDKDGR